MSLHFTALAPNFFETSTVNSRSPTTIPLVLYENCQKMSVDLYQHDIDFAILALQDPAFNKLFVYAFTSSVLVCRWN